MSGQESTVKRLEELTAMRREHVASCERNGDRSHQLIANLYSDSSHFIYELLQNADDAGATEVRFILDESAIRFEHNGSPFEFNNIKAITEIGKSTKIDDVNAIGKFGAGFKSVFAVTNSPRVHSESWHFQIVDFIVPEQIADLYDGKEGWTKFELPFNKTEVPSNDAYERLAIRLRDLEGESLIFLHQIKCIQWSTIHDEGLYALSINNDRVTLLSQVNDQDTCDTEYIVCESAIHIESTHLRLVVAYRLGIDGKIVPVQNSKLFVFFPTNERTGFHFLVHAPYKTTPSRETIPFDDAENKAITEGLAKLIADSIEQLKARDLLNQQAYMVLPIDSDAGHPLYVAAYDEVKWRLKTDALVPTNNGGFTNAKNVLIPADKALSKLLSNSDIRTLLGREAYWVSNELLTVDRVREYLREILEIPEVTLHNFCKMANETFFESKSDDWMVMFYESMSDYEERGHYLFSYLKRDLQRYPFLRLEDNSHLALYSSESDLPQVYLSSRGESGFRTIKRSLALSKESRSFLLMLGLREPDNIAEIRVNILPKYRDRIIDLDEYLLDIHRILDIWDLPEKAQKDGLLELLRSDESQFVRCLDSTGDVKYQPAGNVYFHTKRLTEWFVGNDRDEIYFLDFPEEQLTKKARELFEAAGVRYELKIDGASSVNIEQYGFYQKSVNGFNQNFNIHGLEHALININPQRSFLLWDLLLEHTSKLKGHYKQRFKKKDDWDEGPEQASLAFTLLSAHSWLYLKNEELIVSDIEQYSLNDLAESYRRDKDNVHKLIEALGLKPDQILEIEKRYGGKFITSEEWNEFEEYRRSKTPEPDQVDITVAEHDSPQDNYLAWTPAIDADAAVVVEETPYSRGRPVRDLSGQATTQSSLSAEEKVVDDIMDKSDDISRHHPLNARDIKAIGEHGERVAYRFLLEMHPDKQVVWLNEHGNQGIGYDFVVREADSDLLYYEVKSKTDKSPKLFEISGVQWDWAKQLHKEGRGNMYIILLVSNVGESHPSISRITDPYQLWIEGELYADPVSIKL
jgi:hypothetical protein